jgi:hypothetical protein
LPLREFSETYLEPAIRDALERKRPLVERAEFNCDGLPGECCCKSHQGIHGRYVRYYDIEADHMVSRISLRVMG